MFAALRFNLITVCGWITVLAFCAWALPTMRAELASIDLRERALQISDGRTAPLPAIEQAIDAYRQIEPQLGCRADVRRAGGALLLYRAGAVSPLNPELEEAEQAFRGALACAPWQANGWVVLAHLRAVRLGYDNEAQRLIDVSYALAPREAWIARRRIMLEANADLVRAAAVEERLSNAIREMIEGPFWRDAVDIFVQSPVLGQQRILRAVDTARDDARSRFHFHALLRK